LFFSVKVALAGGASDGNQSALPLPSLNRFYCYAKRLRRLPVEIVFSCAYYGTKKHLYQDESLTPSINKYRYFDICLS
jgi:hypothetical protein